MSERHRASVEHLAVSAERLESWKEIAAYLKRGVRTVRRWEKEEGLPVHRHLHKAGAGAPALPPCFDLLPVRVDRAEG